MSNKVNSHFIVCVRTINSYDDEGNLIVDDYISLHTDVDSLRFYIDLNSDVSATFKLAVFSSSTHPIIQHIYTLNVEDNQANSEYFSLQNFLSEL